MITRRTLLAAGAATLAAPAVLRAQTAGYSIGTLFHLTGGLAELGSVFQAGSSLAFKHIAADGKLKRPLEIHAQDTQSTPQGGAVGMSKLVNVDGAIAVITGGTGVSKAVAPIGTRAKVLMLNGAGVGPDLATLSPYFWNVIPLANQELPVAIDWMKQAGIKRVAIVYLDDPLGAALLKELRGALPGIGAALVGEFSAAPTAQQFAGVAAKIRDTRPDLIYVASYGTQQTQIFKQLRDNGLSQPFMTYSAGGTPSSATLPECNGLLFTSQAADWSASDPVTRRFVDDWRKIYGTDPTTYAQNYYNAALLISELILRLEKDGREVNGSFMRDEITVGTFQLVGGEARFADSGIVMPTQLNQVRDGRFEKIS